MKLYLPAKAWWILAARGGLGLFLGLACAALLARVSTPHPFGLASLFSPFEAVALILVVVGFYAFWDGIFSILLGVQDFGREGPWWSLLLEGLLSLALGAWTWLRPQSGAVLVLLGWIAAWAILTGLLEIHQAFRRGVYPERRGPLAAAGLVSLAFGFILFFFRPAGLGLVWLVGAYAFFFSWPLLVLALRLRRFSSLSTPKAEGAHDPAL
jgi:uncharacterized membrane protein HdeD (DUF308 family)